jgi:hypothetical protein
VAPEIAIITTIAITHSNAPIILRTRTSPLDPNFALNIAIEIRAPKRPHQLARHAPRNRAPKYYAFLPRKIR